MSVRVANGNSREREFVRLASMPERRDDAGLLNCDDVTRGRARNQPAQIGQKCFPLRLFYELALDGTSIAGSEARFVGKSACD